MENLGRLEQINDLRKVWDSEAGNFTPWLARPENLKQLGETIGLDLELEAQEKNVGLFRADILCKDTSDNSWVLIENQLEVTDHTHMGQILTYAAGLKAVTIVWIAKRFTEEHRAAIDWLNEITDERFNFFGLEVELWRIGNSLIAPKFNIVSKPNDWGRIVSKETGDFSPGEKTQFEFWVVFHDFVESRKSIIKPGKPSSKHYMKWSLGRTGCSLAAVASFWDSATERYDGHEVRAEVCLEGQNSKENFKLLFSQKEEIEREMGESLTWRNPDNAKLCRIYVRRSVDLDDRSKWVEYQGWLLEKLEMLRKVFAKQVKSLQ